MTMNETKPSLASSFQFVPAAGKLLRLLDPRADLVGSCCLGAAAAMAAIYRTASPAVSYLLAIGVLLHLACWFSRWWERH